MVYRGAPMGDGVEGCEWLEGWCRSRLGFLGVPYSSCRFGTAAEGGRVGDWYVMCARSVPVQLLYNCCTTRPLPRRVKSVEPGRSSLVGRACALTTTVSTAAAQKRLAPRPYPRLTLTPARPVVHVHLHRRANATAKRDCAEPAPPALHHGRHRPLRYLARVHSMTLATFASPPSPPLPLPALAPPQPWPARRVLARGRTSQTKREDAETETERLVTGHCPPLTPKPLGGLLISQDLLTPTTLLPSAVTKLQSEPCLTKSHRTIPLLTSRGLPPILGVILRCWLLPCVYLQYVQQPPCKEPPTTPLLSLSFHLALSL